MSPEAAKANAARTRITVSTTWVRVGESWREGAGGKRGETASVENQQYSSESCKGRTDGATLLLFRHTLKENRIVERNTMKPWHAARMAPDVLSEEHEAWSMYGT